MVASGKNFGLKVHSGLSQSSVEMQWSKQCVALQKVGNLSTMQPSITGSMTR